LLGLTRAAGAVRAESLSTLKFAQRAKAVRNVARVNEDLDQRTLLRRYEGELRRLRAELQQRQRDVVDKRQLLQSTHARKQSGACECWHSLYSLHLHAVSINPCDEKRARTQSNALLECSTRCLSICRTCRGWHCKDRISRHYNG